MADVRRATAADVEALVDMGRAMHAESPRYSGRAFDAEKVRRLAHHLIGAPLAAVLVAQGQGEIAGMAAVVATEDWFGPDRYVTDLVVYLKPEHRGNGAFALLVLAIEQWAGEHGVPMIDLGVTTGVHPQLTVRAYEAMGYTVRPTWVVSKKLETRDVHRG